MAHTITLKTTFILSFKVLKTDVKKIDLMLVDNKFHPEKWQQVLVPFDSWIEYRVECNLKRAEIIRQLLANFKIMHYD